MVILWYIALVVMLFFGAKICKAKTWNEENMSFDQTKAFLGFAAVIIVFHHCSQATCASWINPRVIRHGLDIFVTAGYPMVAMFLFCSGFGLYKSAKSKPDFFKRFLPVRIIPMLIPTALTYGVYIYFRHIRNIPLKFNSLTAVGTHDTVHPYIWYVPCIILMYILFYIGFGLIRKDWAGILVVFLGTAGYIFYCIKYQYGTWWFNTAHMFLIGILVSKYEKKFFESCKKLYVLRLIMTIVLCAGLWYLGDNAGGLYLQIFRHPYNAVYGYRSSLVGCIFQVLYTLAFMSLYYLISMKLKIGNRILGFLGKFTLELYLVHGIFIHMFGYCMLIDGKKPVYYIENVPLFVLVVLGAAIPISFVLSLLDKKVGKLLRPKKK